MSCRCQPIHFNLLDQDKLHICDYYSIWWERKCCEWTVWDLAATALQLFSKVGGKMSNLWNILAVTCVTWIGPRMHCLHMWTGGVFYLHHKPTCHHHPQLGTLRMNRPFPSCWWSIQRSRSCFKVNLPQRKRSWWKQRNFFCDQTLEPRICWFFEQHALKAWPGGLQGHQKKALSI